MKLLIALDSSPSSDSVIDEVKGRLWPPDAEARLITVIDTSDFIGVKGDIRGFLKNEIEAARAALQPVGDTMSGAGLKAACHVVEGYAPVDIVEYAKDWGADVIFLGSHGHSALARFFLGSVSASVLRHAPCSVVIARPRKAAGGEATKVLVGVDGSECSIAAVRSIAQRPWPVGTEFQILGVVEEVIPAIDPWYAGGVAVERIRAEAEKLVANGVQAAEATLKESGLSVTSSTMTGHPKAALVDKAGEWGASLIVVGSHGRSGLARVLLGSVSEAVAIHAHCSVEVIRERSGLY